MEYQHLAGDELVNEKIVATLASALEQAKRTEFVDAKIEVIAVPRMTVSTKLGVLVMPGHRLSSY